MRKYSFMPVGDRNMFSQRMVYRLQIHVDCSDNVVINSYDAKVFTEKD